MTTRIVTKAGLLALAAHRAHAATTAGYPFSRTPYVFPDGFLTDKELGDIREKVLHFFTPSPERHDPGNGAHRDFEDPENFKTASDAFRTIIRDGWQAGDFVYFPEGLCDQVDEDGDQYVGGYAKPDGKGKWFVDLTEPSLTKNGDYLEGPCSCEGLNDFCDCNGSNSIKIALDQSELYGFLHEKIENKLEEMIRKAHPSIPNIEVNGIAGEDNDMMYVHYTKDFMQRTQNEPTGVRDGLMIHTDDPGTPGFKDRTIFRTRRIGIIINIFVTVEYEGGTYLTSITRPPTPDGTRRPANRDGLLEWQLEWCKTKLVEVQELQPTEGQILAHASTCPHGVTKVKERADGKLNRENLGLYTNLYWDEPVDKEDRIKIVQDVFGSNDHDREFARRKVNKHPRQPERTAVDDTDAERPEWATNIGF